MDSDPNLRCILICGILLLMVQWRVGWGREGGGGECGSGLKKIHSFSVFFLRGRWGGSFFKKYFYKGYVLSFLNHFLKILLKTHY